MKHGDERLAREILSGLPSRIHRVLDAPVSNSPGHTALIDDTSSLTYAELQEATQAAARKLTDLGVRSGDRMMIVSENCIPLAVLLLAASAIDAWAIVANPRMSDREIDQIVAHSGARRVFLTASVSKEAAAHAARLQAEVVESGQLRSVAVGKLNESTTAEPIETDPAKQVAVLIYTSGTTGTPKGVMLTHRNLLFSGASTAAIRKSGGDDKLYCVLPISHIVGISLLILTLMTGGTVRLVSRYEPAALAKAIAEEGITILNGVPATYQRLLEYKTVAGLAKLDPGRLRYIGVAGAPLDLDLKTRVQQELGISLLNGYGITECAPGISSVRIEKPRNDNAVGTLMPGLEARIVAPDGTEVSDGTVGELHVRGANVMLGYYRAPDLTKKAIDGEGWFNTGDLARFEGDCLFIVGRTKEMIIRSGFNVYPAEVEAVLNSHESVVQSAVVGRSVAGNEEVVAFVQVMPGSAVGASDLMAYVTPLLTSYKRPSEIVVIDALPATSTGKILKHKLAESLKA